MMKIVFVVLALAVAMAAAAPYYSLDENRDGLFDGFDRNRDGKPDFGYYGPGYYGYGYGFPYYGGYRAPYGLYY